MSKCREVRGGMSKCREARGENHSYAYALRPPLREWYVFTSE